MAEETVVAAPSAAAAEPPKFTQFDGWDDEGNPTVTKKAEAPKQDKAATAAKPGEAESAAADTSKKTKTEDAADSAANKKQEPQPKNRTEARIKELLARAEKAEKDLAEARKPNATKADPSPAPKPEEKPAAAPPTRPKPTALEKGTDGKPKYSSYEDFVEDLADWKAEQRMAAQQREQRTQQFLQDLGKKLKDARERYADYDEKAKPVQQELVKPDMPRAITDVLNDSPVLPDLLYAIGGSDATKTDFLEACRTNPGKALRVVLLMEQEIVKELAKGKPAAKKVGEGEAETAPEVVKPKAPKPPSEVGGRGAPGEDALVSAAKTGNFRDFDAEQTRRALASRR